MFKIHSLEDFPYWTPFVWWLSFQFTGGSIRVNCIIILHKVQTKIEVSMGLFDLTNNFFCKHIHRQRKYAY